MSQNTHRLDPGHWITLAGLAVQAVAIMAVVVWRVGAVERRLETMDARLWEISRRTPVASTAVPSLCYPDATAVRLTVTPEHRP